MTKYDPQLNKCLICLSTDIYKYHQSSDGSQIYKCRNCKVQFMNPQYTDEYLADMYSRYTSDEPAYYESIDQSHLDCLLMIEKYYPAKGRLFDIGSGTGNLIHWAQKRGWSAAGYDVDPDTVNKISSRINVKMYSGKFEDLHLEEDSYDVVSMLHVLEHLKNPMVYLNIIKKILRKDGLLFIALPNIQSRSGNVKFLLEKAGLKRKNIAAYYDTGHHLFYFTPLTIRRTLVNNGFSVKVMYSGRSAELPLNLIHQWIKERIISKFTWPSNMALIAIKK